MKQIFFIVLFLSAFAYSNPVLNHFDIGNQFYQAGKYPEAIKSYEQILNAGQHSSELYFNLGNCYYKMNKTAPAIYNFEKALLLNPNDCEIKNNLNFAKKATTDDITEMPKVGFMAFVQSFTSSFYFETWAWTAIGFSILFLLSFLFYFFSNSTVTKRLFFTLMIVFLVTNIISVFAGFYEKNNFENMHFAIVFDAAASVKSEPKTSSTEVFVIHEGKKVTVLETLNSYKKIQLPDLKTGWIKSSSIKEFN